MCSMPRRWWNEIAVKSASPWAVHQRVHSRAVRFRQMAKPEAELSLSALGTQATTTRASENGPSLRRSGSQSLCGADARAGW